MRAPVSLDTQMRSTSGALASSRGGACAILRSSATSRWSIRGIHQARRHILRSHGGHEGHKKDKDLADRLLTAPTWSEVISLLRKRREESERNSEGAGEVVPTAPGQVFLVGTGPGDPSLLTLRAVQLMQTADVVLYDRLVSEDILSMIHPGARMVYVGKGKGFHSSRQEDIHELLLQFAESGATVVRLKGGDPYVFGRGGEELEYLEQRGIRVWCVPGITAAAGICAELGIPMTHRGVATSVRFLTGHVRDAPEAQEQLDECVRVAADSHTTLVVYMGLSTLPSLVATLVSSGLSPDTPAVAVERGTTAQQRAVGAPLHELEGKVANAGLKSPTLLVIGPVCALSPHYESLVREDVVEGQIVPRPRSAWTSGGESKVETGSVGEV